MKNSKEFCPEKGFVYVIGNPLFNNMVKIGRSGQDPSIRAQSFSTGSPHPYCVYFEILARDYEKIEKSVHKALAPKQIKNGAGSEWFEVSTMEAIKAIKAVAGTNILWESKMSGIPNGYALGEHGLFLKGEEEGALDPLKIEAALLWLELIDSPKMEDIQRFRHTYRFKHIAEQWCHLYITSGAMIAAAEIAGFKMELARYADGYDVYLNISEEHVNRTLNFDFSSKDEFVAYLQSRIDAMN